MSDLLYVVLGLATLFLLVEGPDLVIRFLIKKIKNKDKDGNKS